MVYLYVGDNNLPIQVHRNVVLRSSHFFRNALNGAFKESFGTTDLHVLCAQLDADHRVGIVNLQEQRRDLVEVYVEWLHFGVINALEADGNDELRRFTQLYDLFVLADMLQDEVFANATMDVLIRETDAKETWPTGLVAYAWSELPESSVMRKYLRDLWVARSYSTWYSQLSGDITDAPKEFWIEVAKTHTLIREKKEKMLKPAWTTRCKYHTHSDGSKCASDLATRSTDVLARSPLFSTRNLSLCRCFAISISTHSRHFRCWHG